MLNVILSLQEIVQTLLPSYTFCLTTQRFVPGPKVGPFPDLENHEGEAMLWGLGGPLFLSWAAAHKSFFGAPHLKSFLHTCGTLSYFCICKLKSALHVIDVWKT